MKVLRDFVAKEDVDVEVGDELLVYFFFRSFLAKTNHSPRGSSSSASIRLEHFAFVVAISVVSFGIWTFKNVFLSDVVEGSLLFFSASSNSLHNLNGKTNGNKENELAT